jgi:hypothetical protein
MTEGEARAVVAVLAQVECGPSHAWAAVALLAAHAPDVCPAALRLLQQCEQRVEERRLGAAELLLRQAREMLHALQRGAAA